MGHNDYLHTTVKKGGVEEVSPQYCEDRRSSQLILISGQRLFRWETSGQQQWLNKVHISAVTCSTSLCLAFPANVERSISLKTQTRCTQLPENAVPCLLEIYQKPLSQGHPTVMDKNNVGPQWCLLQRGSTVYTIANKITNETTLNLFVNYYFSTFQLSELILNV